jgi:hypothetical protein
MCLHYAEDQAKRRKQVFIKDRENQLVKKGRIIIDSCLFYYIDYFIQGPPNGTLMLDSAYTVAAIRYKAEKAQTMRI